MLAVVTPATASAATSAPLTATGGTSRTQELHPATAQSGELSLAAGQRQPMAVKQDCATVRANLRAYARNTRKPIGCLSPSTPSAVAGKGATAEVAIPQVGESTPCDDLAANEWWYNRTLACIHDETTTFTEYDSEDGAVLGTAVLSLDQVIEPNSASTAWTEQVSLTMTAAEGEVSVLDASLVDTCTSPCTTTGTDAFDGDDEVTDGETLLGSVQFEDSPASGTQNLTLGENLLTVLQPGTDPINSEESWNDSLQVRCDDSLSSDIVEGADDSDAVQPADADPPDEPAGCVYPTAIPTFEPSLGTYKGSAAMILWAQNYLPGAWGTQSNPLHRYSGRARQRANRSVICGTSSGWTTVTTVTDDSCDEFPFAATTESGALNGLTGPDCAEIEPIQDPVTGTWSVLYNEPVTYTEGCVRAHVTLGDNTGLGRALGTFTVLNRVLDGDPYYLTVVA